MDSDVYLAPGRESQYTGRLHEPVVQYILLKRDSVIYCGDSPLCPSEQRTACSYRLTDGTPVSPAGEPVPLVNRQL